MKQTYGAHVAVSPLVIVAHKTPIEYLLDRIEGGLRNLYVATILNHDEPDWQTLEIETRRESFPYDENDPIVLFRLTVDGRS